MRNEKGIQDLFPYAVLDPGVVAAKNGGTRADSLRLDPSRRGC